MKKIIVTLLISASLGLSACQDTFLQMPDTTGTVDLNEVYGSAKNAKSALMTCYREALIHGLPGGWGVGHGTLGASAARFRAAIRGTEPIRSPSRGST